MTTENKNDTDKLNEGVELLTRAHDLCQEEKIPHLIAINHDLGEMGNLFTHMSGFNPSVDICMMVTDTIWGVLSILSMHEIDADDLVVLVDIAKKYEAKVGAASAEIKQGKRAALNS